MAFHFEFFVVEIQNRAAKIAQKLCSLISLSPAHALCPSHGPPHPLTLMSRQGTLDSSARACTHAFCGLEAERKRQHFCFQNYFLCLNHLQCAPIRGTSSPLLPPNVLQSRLQGGLVLHDVGHIPGVTTFIHKPSDVRSWFNHQSSV